MNQWTTIYACTYSHEAHLIKGKLESEGIAVVLQDELTAQINVFNSCAIGGIKLQVQETDCDNARRILTESGYIDADIEETDSIFAKLDQHTEKLPFIGPMPFEKRLFIGAILILFTIVTPILLLVLSF